MRCPPEIAAILLGILRTGILRVRAMGWSQQADRCAVEADHIHNLPDLLNDYHPDRLRFYWETERTSFLQQSQHEEMGAFQLLWDRLATLLCSDSATSSAK
jgi:hypothetical protein